MIEVSLPGASQAELRELLRGLSPEVGVLAPPDIESASSADIGVVLVNLVNTLPALLTAVAALWAARTAAKPKRELKAIILETTQGQVTVSADEVGDGQTRLPDISTIKSIRLEMT
jgi:hypothetical protein